MSEPDLPRELLEDIFLRVPLASLKAVGSTCQNWNAVSKDRSFTSKHMDKAPREREFLMIMDFQIYLISVNLRGTHNNDFDLSINRKGKLISLDNSDEIFYIYQVFHCNGVCLCVSRNKGIARLVVWNPYFGETRWIDPMSKHSGYERFALGYDTSCGSHKILRFYERTAILEIYDLSTNLWRSLSVPPEWWWDAMFEQHGVSLKGNTYWFVRDKETQRYVLICFDFTTEKFEQRQFVNPPLSSASLSVIREEKLAALLEHSNTSEIEIFVTDKIESDAMSWTSFLEVDMKPLPAFFAFGNFLIDEEKKVAVVFDKEEAHMLKPSSNTAYIIGENGYFKSVDLKQSPNTQLCPLECSYVPSSAQIN